MRVDLVGVVTLLWLLLLERTGDESCDFISQHNNEDEEGCSRSSSVSVLFAGRSGVQQSFIIGFFWICYILRSVCVWGFFYIYRIVCRLTGGDIWKKKIKKISNKTLNLEIFKSNDNHYNYIKLYLIFRKKKHILG